MTGAVNAGGTWTNVTPATVLAGMLDVLSDEDKWCQKYAAKTVTGTPCAPSADAVQFCMMGAMDRALERHAYGWSHTEAGWDLHNQVSRLIVDELPVDDCVLRTWAIPTFNDDPSTTFEDVRLVLKRALGEAQ